MAPSSACFWPLPGAVLVMPWASESSAFRKKVSVLLLVCVKA